MPRNKNTRKKQQKPGVMVGNISDVGGDVNVAAGDITTHHVATGLSAADVGQLFDQIYAGIENRADTTPGKKENLQDEVQQIQSQVTEAVQKKENIDEAFLLRRFRNIASMAPDLLDVIVATLANPLAGLGVAVAKLAKKAKEEMGPT